MARGGLFLSNQHQHLVDVGLDIQLKRVPNVTIDKQRSVTSNASWSTDLVPMRADENQRGKGTIA